MGEVKEKSKTILIVDDTPANLTVASGILKDQYRVKVAKTGERSLAIAAKDRAPDLILLDIMMPEMDGWEVCKRLKENEKTRSIPVIFMSAKKEQSDIERGKSLGAVDYLTKPLNPSVVHKTINKHLNP